MLQYLSPIEGAICQKLDIVFIIPRMLIYKFAVKSLLICENFLLTVSWKNSRPASKSFYFNYVSRNSTFRKNVFM